MKTKAQEYRENAANAAEMASTASDEPQRNRYKRMETAGLLSRKNKIGLMGSVRLRSDEGHQARIEKLHVDAEDCILLREASQGLAEEYRAIARRLEELIASGDLPAISGFRKPAGCF